MTTRSSVDRELHDVLRAKLAVVAEAGLAGSVTTQMCLDAPHIIRWLTDERDRGLDVPVDIGVAGVVDRAKLLTMGVRLGVGTSLRFLRKNRSVVTSMFAPGGYDPTDLVTRARRRRTTTRRPRLALVHVQPGGGDAGVAGAAARRVSRARAADSSGARSAASTPT